MQGKGIKITYNTGGHSVNLHTPKWCFGLFSVAFVKISDILSAFLQQFTVPEISLVITVYPSLAAINTSFRAHCYFCMLGSFSSSNSRIAF